MRPKFSLSAKPGCAPMETPLSLASATVARMMESFPAWNPHAILALLIRGMSLASLSMPSPISQLRSICLVIRKVFLQAEVTGIFELAQMLFLCRIQGFGCVHVYQLKANTISCIQLRQSWKRYRCHMP